MNFIKFFLTIIATGFLMYVITNHYKNKKENIQNVKIQNTCPPNKNWCPAENACINIHDHCV